MIVGYFGVPRVGKNTVLTMIAQRELKLMKQGKSRYEHIYTDFYCSGCEKFQYSDFRIFKAYNSLFLIQEMGLNADGREFKNFTPQERDWFALHGHVNCDIFYATHDYSDVDKKIRDKTEELWYLTKSCVPILRNFTVATRIFRTIAINEMTSELVNGYRFSTLLEKLFSRVRMICFRPLYYRFFDSHSEESLLTRPVMYSIKWDDFINKLNKMEMDAADQQDDFSSIFSVT